MIPLKFASEQHRSQREVDLFMSELNKIPHDKLRSVSGLQLTSSELLGRRPDVTAPDTTNILEKRVFSKVQISVNLCKKKFDNSQNGRFVLFEIGFMQS